MLFEMGCSVLKLEKKKLIIMLSAAAVVVLVLFGVLGFWLPWHQAANSMDPDSTLVLRSQEDGGLLVSWPAGINADRYLVEVLRQTPGADGTETEPEIYTALSSRMARSMSCGTFPGRKR